MDCAKGINFLYSCGGRMQDYWGEGKATGPLLPMIAVPTTAGTGSETQSYALISDAETHVKMACGDKRAAFRVAILDPGADAHAAAARHRAHRHRRHCRTRSKRTSPSAATRSRWRSAARPGGIWRRISPACWPSRNNLEARGEMQLGACFAGLAIENSMLGAAHALANPLTANFGIAHGEAVALMLPHVIRHNGRHVGDVVSRAGRGGARSSVSNRRRRSPPKRWPTFVAELRQRGRAGWYTYRVRRDARTAARAGRRRHQAMDRQVQSRRTDDDDFLRLYEAAF